MWFSLFVTILILAVTFYQGIQGLFSALINCILAILAAALAFGFYEDLYVAQLMAHQPDHGRAIALIAIFVVSLLVMRMIVDQLIKNNMHFPMHLDRAGGGIFGFVTAMIIIGMLAIGFQMLPFGSTFLGFSRFSLVDEASNKEIINAVKNASRVKDDDSLKDAVFRSEMDWSKVKVSHHSLWLSPDGFTLALISRLSNNAFAGRNRFVDLNPNFLDYLHHMRDGLGRESLDALGPGAVSVKEYQYLRENEPVYNKGKARDEKTGSDIVKYDLVNRKPESGKRWMCITAAINEKSEKCQDRENLNFTSSQIRLLARDRRDGPVATYPLTGINDSDPDNDHRILLVSPCQDIQYKRESGSQMRLLFEVPDDSDFQPLAIQYKMNGRAEILASHNATEDKPGKTDSTKKSGKPAPKDKPKDQPPKDDTTPAEPTPAPDANTTASPPDSNGSSTAPPSDPNPRGRVHGVNLANVPPFFSDKLPFGSPLTEYDEGTELQHSGSKLVGVRSLSAKLDKDWEPAQGSRAPLETFDVPEDRRLLQLTVEQLHAESWLGNIMETATNTVRNIYLIDSNGKEYMPIGKYAIATIRGQTIFELTYLDDIARGNARMPGFQHIRFDDLKGKYAYVFLFHVPPGTRPAKLHTGRANIELNQFNLVAPK